MPDFTFPAARRGDMAESGERKPFLLRSGEGEVLTKLMARDRAQLVITAYEIGLVTPRPPHR
jgi:hypothetical protein